MSPPVVGTVGYHHDVPRPFGALAVSGAPRAYGDAVRAAGGLALLLPQEDAIALLGIVDALVLAGGGDLDPGTYGGTGPANGVDPARDEVELALAHAAIEAGVPVLGVCRGLQVLAVAYGGTLHGVQGHVLPETGHHVRTAAGSTVHALLGDTATTSALHQQAVSDLGPAWRASAWTDDGVIEAIEPTDPAWRALGVQWHPELTRAPFRDRTGAGIFGWLVSTARKEGHGRQVLAGRR